MRKCRRLALVLTFLIGLRATPVLSSSSRNPYATLGVSPSASQKEIQKAYRQQCLRLHPDKNTHRTQQEREWCEAKFKQVQQAYSMIGNHEERRSFDLDERYGAFAGGRNHRPSSPSGPGRRAATATTTTGNPTMDAFFRAYGHGGPSVFFTQGPDGRPRFGVRRAFPSGPADFMPTTADDGISTFKSIYVQKVQVPLEKLYTGAEIEFHLVDNVWVRWRAAIRGKMIYLSVYQGLLYSIPIIRTNKVLAGIIGLFITHITLPKPDPLQSYRSTLPRGTRVARVRFKQNRNDQPEIIFEIQVAPHKRYLRDGDNLRTHVRIAPAEAERGCTKEIPSLDPEQPPITICIPPHTANGREICIQGKGWPVRNTEDHGDLVVRVEVKEDRGRHRGKQRKKNQS